MIKDDLNIRALMYRDLVDYLSESREINITEARNIISELSFINYCSLMEEIIPPSGQPIGPVGSSTGVSTNSSQATNSPTQAPNNIKSIWPGKGAPVEVGMTVGLKGPNGLPVPGQISQVDLASKGVKIKNPTTGQDEWANMDSLEPFMAASNQNNSTVPQNSQNITTEEFQQSEQLRRLKELAGIKENCSSGATSSSAIAISPTSMSGVKKRQSTDEEIKKEYVPKEAAKTIIGDTKPHQASGELSSNLAVRGKKTASRNNNGFKK